MNGKDGSMNRSLALAVLWILCSHSAARDKVTVDSILDKHDATMNRFQSFIVRMESRRKSGARKPGYRGPVDKFFSTEVRYDGKRRLFASRGQTWGLWSPSFPRAETKEEGPYNSDLVDGKAIYVYARPATHGDSPPGELFLYRKKRAIEKRAQRLPQDAFGVWGGYFWSDDEPIRTILRKARHKSVRRDLETVAGSQAFDAEADDWTSSSAARPIGTSRAYRVEAVSPRGKHTAWFDPDHDYHIVKVELEKIGKQGMFFNKKQEDGPGYRTDIHISATFGNFKKVDDVWVPMESWVHCRRDFGYFNDRRFSEWTDYTKRMEFISDPDHDALHSFVPDDIPEGAEVRFPRSRRGHLRAGVEYRWQNGKVWGDGKIVFDSGVQYPAKLPGGEFPR